MNNLNSAQVEQLKEIGAKLRQLRQQQAISTEEVAAKTFISSRMLTALEEGQSDHLPEPIFIQGFIRRYAEALDLDGAALANSFPTNNLLPIPLESASEEVAQAPSRAMPLYIVYLLLMVAAASGLFFLVHTPQTAKPPVPQQKDLPVAQQQKPVAQPQPAPVTPTPTSSSVTNVPIQVAVNLTDESWMEVIVDGKTEFEGTLTKGTQKTWTAQKQLSITAGNAGAVLISSNQDKQKPLGDLGDVKKVTFPTEN